MKRSTQIVIGGIALVVVAAAAVVTIALNSGATKRSSNAEAQANPTLPPIVPIGTLVANILSQKTPPATLLTAISQPPPAVTHVPEGYANTINDAIRLIGPLFAGEAGSVSSVRIDHVNYVETTAGQAFTLFAPSYLARLSSYNLTSSTPVWAFVVRGAFHQAAEEAGRIVPPAGAVTVFPEMWGIVPEGSYRFTLGSISSQNPDLTTLGTPVEVMPGQDSEIDRVRAPLMIAVGAPSLVSGAVQVPIDAANPFNASLVPYTGVNVHLRWNPAVFTYGGLNTTGSVLPSPFCLTAISQDADGGGMVLGCASLGGQTTATGLLATIILTPAASGCSALHLFTYVKQDHGDTTTGTYVINAFSGQPLPVGYVDGTADVSGQVCTP